MGVAIDQPRQKQRSTAIHHVLTRKRLEVPDRVDLAIHHAHAGVVESAERLEAGVASGKVVDDRRVGVSSDRVVDLLAVDLDAPAAAVLVDLDRAESRIFLDTAPPSGNTWSADTGE